ncbi:DUF3617 domain-containing protein [Bosea sp. RAF48]|uniref:DUF3617 domain-containing protein n=1 Tax=Bosea sp. RAF48 TaxID=3237480 RepID=UPI003F904420
MKRAFAAFSLLLLVQGAYAGERFEPGLWQSTAFIGGKKGRVTGPRCVTTQEAQSMNGSASAIRKVLEVDPAWQGCAIGEVRTEGMQVDFTATCAGAVVTTSRTTYRGSSYEGTITVTRPETPALAMSIRGERVGACP